MNAKLCLMALLAGLGATGCQSLKAPSQYNHKVSFANFRSFCWVAPPAYLSNDVRLHMDQLTPLVREDIEQHLLAKGYVSTDCADNVADFRVSFRVALRDSLVQGRSEDYGQGGVAIYEYNSETGGQWFTSPSERTVNVQREGSLIILIMDPKSDHVLWNGSLSTNL